jgi:hypothetical protein
MRCEDPDEIIPSRSRLGDNLLLLSWRQCALLVDSSTIDISLERRTYQETVSQIHMTDLETASGSPMTAV